MSRTREGLRHGHLQVSGDHWPIFLYHEYSYDPEYPWKGLLRSEIIVSVSVPHFQVRCLAITCMRKAFKHIFTSPSSVGKEPKATRSGNARIHNMKHVTPASISYVATQVRRLARYVFRWLMSPSSVSAYRRRLYFPERTL
jgi:hypothetical protein